MRPVRLRLRLGLLVVQGCQGNLRGVSTRLFLVVAVAEGHLLAELLGGDAVQIRAVGTELEAHALDVLLNGEILCRGCAALLVGDGGMENAESRDLYAVALCYDLRNGLSQTNDDLFKGTAVETDAQGNQVLGKSTGGQRSLIVYPCKPAVVDSRGGVDDLLKVEIFSFRLITLFCVSPLKILAF